MSSAIFDGLDATPPVYTSYGWFMLHYIIPYVEPTVMFRVTNAIIVAATIIILYMLVRRFFDVTKSIIIILFFVLSSLSNLSFFITELRTYALFFCATTISIYLSERAIRDPSPSKFLYMGLSYCFLAMSHTFGIVYALCISGSLILVFISSANFSLARNTLISVVPAILLFSVWSIVMAHQAKLGSWIPKPSLHDLSFAAYLPISLRMKLVAIDIGLVVAIIYIYKKGLFTITNSLAEWWRSPDSTSKFVAMIPISFGLSTLAIWLLSRHLFSVFVIRYFFPNMLCNVIWIGLFVYFIFMKLPRIVATCGMLCAIIPLVIFNIEHIPSELIKLSERIPCFDPVQETYIEDPFRDGTPILTLWMHSWLTRLDHRGDEKIFPIDQALAKQSDVENQKYNFEFNYAARFAAWEGYPSIIKTEDLLGAKRNFLVLDDDHGPWLRFVQQTHKLKLTKLAEMKGCRLWRLEIGE